MHLTRISLWRAGLIGAVLSISGALVAYASLPTAADGGQARAEAGSANGQGEEHANEHANQNAGGQGSQDKAAVMEQLAANQARLLATLNDVLARLGANDNVPQAATDALQTVIDRLGGDVGLNRAMDAVGGNTGHPDLPEAATNHPGKP